MLELGIRCVRRAVSGSVLTGFGEVACVSLLLVLSCVLSPVFAKAPEGDGCTSEMKVKEGSGTSSSPYRIATLCQLQDISSTPTAHYLLVASIDASTATDFEPIASREKDGFSGSFVNASTHVISSLTISRSNTEDVGLFSSLAAGAMIRGIVLVGSRTTGRYKVGSLVGYNEGVIEGCSATGSVTGQTDVGGLVGRNEEGSSVSRSYAAGSVTGTDSGSNVGGLVGWNSGDISDSSATGSVSGDYEVGGLVGQQESGSSIRDSYATGSVSGQGDVGGLVGWSRGNINYGYATGSVSGQKNVGGLAGLQSFNSSISNSYATGLVFGTGDISNGVGGLVGYQGGSINNTYATGSVSGNDQVGGLVGFSPRSNTGNSYYAVRGRNNGLGEERTFAQLRCPTMSSKTCPSGSQESALSYEGWDTNVWDFGSVTDLPQLLSNRNPELNRKPYIESSTELVVGSGFTGVTQLSLEADYPGSPDGSVVLTWSLLLDESSRLGDFFYFVLEDGTTSTEANGSVATLAVVGDDRLTADLGFYIVLKNNVSANDDRIRVRTEKAPYIFRNDTVSARIGSTATFSFSVGYEGTPGQPVALTWSLFGVPSTLRHLVYFDLGGGTTSTTFADPGRRLTGDASVVTLVVVGNEELAGKSFYVVLKNGISANADRILIRTEAGQPYILPDDDIEPAGIEGITTFSFSVGYTGSSEPVTLTWSFLDVPHSLDGLVYFDLGDGTSSTRFTNSGVLTADSSSVTLVVANNEGLAGNGFYVVLKNNISDSVDRIPIRIVGASPLVAGRREQTGMIWDGSTRTILRFSATDPDSPGSGGAGLSWSFSSTDRITMGSAVVFSGSQTGGIVEVEVVRPSLDFYGVGSFVLEVESPAGVKTMITVTIETVCSLVPGEDLMAGQTGKGTLDDRYQIKRLCQLQDISSSPTAHYVLVNDIDASETRDWNDGAGFEPIASGEQGGFMGSFVSTGNYEISSLTINRVNTNAVGLFSKLAQGATVRGVILVGSRMTGSYSVGSLVGFNNGGVIEDCSATGSVSGEYEAGGLVGWNNGNINNGYAMGSVSGGTQAGGLVGKNGAGASVSRSHADSTVTGQNKVGGLVGSSDGGISGSSATGSVSGTRDAGSRIGGLVGRLDPGASISDSYAVNTVTGADSVGGLVGQQDLGASISGSYAVNTVTGTDSVGGLVGHQDLGASISGSYAVHTVTGARSVGGLVGLSAGSISGSSATGSVLGTGSFSRDTGGLVGHQDPGASITGSSAVSTVTGANPVGGLVGHQEPGASISDSFAVSTVTGTNQVGGLVGRSGGVISGSSATGSVFGTRRFGNRIGGLVGHQDANSSIRDSYAASTVTGANYVGGLVGSQDGNSSIRDSYAVGTVTGADYVGGLVGSSTGSISRSYASSTVTGTDFVGGFVGRSAGSISRSYASSTVTGTDFVGGLVGSQDGNSSISDCYTVSIVTGADYVGGLVGRSAGSISRSYASSTVTGTDFVGGLVGSQDGNSSISDSYATGSVFGQRRVGGLVGESTGSINNSYADNVVRGNEYVGGLVGSSKGSISNTFAVSTVSTVRGTTTKIGGLVGFSEGSIVVNSYHADRVCLTMSAAMFSRMCVSLADTYAEWDRTVWDFGSTGGLPTLRRQEGDGGDSTAIPLRVRVYLGGAVR